MSSSSESDTDIGETGPASLDNPFTEAGYQKLLLPDGAFCMDAGNTHSAQKYTFKQRISVQLDQESQEFLNRLSSHQDIFYLQQRPDASHDRMLRLLAAHFLNYLLTTRDAIIKNNLRLAKNAGAEVRDQGFTRPRILFICPFKNTAYKLVSYMMDLWNDGADGQVEQKKRFVDEFGKCVDSDGDEIEGAVDDGQPPDYQHVFSGNIDDCFRIGVKMTRKALKLFSDFYSADLLVASPLGLKLLIDGQDKAASGKKHPSRSSRKYVSDCDYLSSIESVVVDQADIITMQNWEHLVEIFEKLNCLPKDAHGCDFSRVLSVFLDNRGSLCRQSVFLSAFGFPELSALTSKFCKNVFGSQTLEHPTWPPIASLAKTRPELHILPPSDSPAAEADNRFRYFTDQLMKTLSSLHHIVLFVSNYFEFLRVKDHLESIDSSFAAVSEYSDQKEVTRARSRFYNGHTRILLLTERLHFFHRFQIKGVKRVCFYSLPAYPVHFREFVDMIDLNKDGVCAKPIIVLSEYDRSKLERIVGTRNMGKMDLIN